MRLASKLFAFAAATCLFAGGAAAQNSPIYDSWAGHKPGTTVTLKNTGEMMGNKTEMDMTATLVEVTPEKVVVEMKATINAMGQKIEQPAQKQDFPAKLAEGQPADPIEAAKKAGAEVKDLGEETVTIGGTAFTCKVFEATLKQGETSIVSKTWTSKEMPGMLVKVDGKMTGQMSGTNVMEVTAVDKK